MRDESAPIPHGQNYPRMSDEEFGEWRALIEDKIGLHVRDAQVDFLKRRLWKRMCALSCGSYADYYHLVTGKDEEKREWRQLMELLVNQESGFFRHLPSYDALMDIVLPELVETKRAAGDPLLSMWSAGCSKGQEPYSMVMAHDRVFGPEKSDRLMVAGTDISGTALARAREGVYTFFEVRNMPEPYRKEYITPMDENNSVGSPAPRKGSTLARNMGRFRVKERIQRRVRFGRLNLKQTSSAEPDESFMPLQDVIFCQNVLIYFQPGERVRTISMLLKHLRTGGYLFLAPGESVGVRIEGAATRPFKDALAYKRNKEAVHVQIAH